MEKCIYYLTVIDSSSRASEANSVNIKKQIVITSEKRLKHTDIRKISNYIISSYIWQVFLIFLFILNFLMLYKYLS